MHLTTHWLCTQALLAQAKKYGDSNKANEAVGKGKAALHHA